LLRLYIYQKSSKLALNHDISRLAAALSNHIISLWDVQEHKSIATLDGSSAAQLMFSSLNCVLASLLKGRNSIVERDQQGIHSLSELRVRKARRICILARWISTCFFDEDERCLSLGTVERQKWEFYWCSQGCWRCRKAGDLRGWFFPRDTIEMGGGYLWHFQATCLPSPPVMIIL